MIKTALILFLATLLSLQGLTEIRSGFESGQVAPEETLVVLKKLLQADGSIKANKKLSVSQKAKLKSQIRRVEQLITWKEITKDLILQFKIIAPDLYEEMNSLNDNEGTAIDVYIKFLPHWKMRYSPSAATRFSYEEKSQRIYTNEYGINSVSIHISFDEIKALSLLAHELGHLRYIVQNISTYYDFYTENYQQNKETNMIGHLSDDSSSVYAKEFERGFRHCYKQYRRRSNPTGGYLASGYK